MMMMMTCLPWQMMRMTISCLLLRSPKRIADEAELVSGFKEVDFSCFCGVLPGFFVEGADFLEERKEMSDFSVEEVVGCFVEEEKEWANASGWTFGGRESFSAFGHCNERLQEWWTKTLFKRPTCGRSTVWEARRECLIAKSER